MFPFFDLLVEAIEQFTLHGDLLKLCLRLAHLPDNDLCFGAKTDGIGAFFELFYLYCRAFEVLRDLLELFVNKVELACRLFSLLLYTLLYIGLG